MQAHRTTTSLPRWLRLWFVVDLLLALLPPLHWASGRMALFGLPGALVYLFGTAACITASVLAAFVALRDGDA